MLTLIDSIPDGLLSLAAPDLHKKLSGPTLIHLSGKNEPSVFVSVLLHGNEHTGWEAIRKLLYESGGKLPRSLSVFIGNVQAARHNSRFLDGQPDFNRIWDGGETPEHKMMQQIINEMKNRGIFLSADIHNNTGKNPHYACVNKTYNEFLQVAVLFSRTVVYFIRPKGVQSMAFANLCPSVTVECGTSGDKHGIDHALQFVNSCLNLKDISKHAIESGDINLYHTVAVVKIPSRYSFGFDKSDYDLQLDKSIEDYNFNELPEGTTIGQVRDHVDVPLDIRDEQGNEVSHQYFTVNNGALKSRADLIPAMITLDTEIIRKDCLCYLMEYYQPVRKTFF